MKVILNIIIVVFFAAVSFGQDKSDSLFRELKKWEGKSGIAADTNLYNIYYELGKNFQATKIDTAIYFFNKSIVFAKKQGATLKLGESLRLKGWLLTTKGEYQSAYKYLNQADTLAKKRLHSHESKKAKKLLASILQNIGGIEIYQGNYPKAIELANQALQKFKEINEIEGQSACIGNIGLINMYQGNFDEAITYFSRALQLSKSIGLKKMQTNDLSNIGACYLNKGEYPKALIYFLEALSINQEINNKSGEGINLGNIGLIYAYQGNYKKALDYYFKALKVNEELGQKRFQLANLANIGLAFESQNNSTKAITYYKKSLKICEEIGDKESQASLLSSIGGVYFNNKDYQKSLEYLNKALQIQENIGSKRGIASTHTVIGQVYFSLNKPDKALEYLYKSLILAREIGFKQCEAEALGEIGYILIKQKKYKEAEKHLSQAIEISKELGIIIELKNFYQAQSELYYQTSNYKEAYEAYKKHIMYRDSVLSEENQKATVQKEMQYEFDKKEALQKAAQDKKDAVAAEKSRKQVFQRNSFVVGFILMLGLAFMAFRSYHNKRRDNVIISKQKQEVEQQKHLVEEKNQEILDSIAYARRIQSAILPPERLVKKYLPDSFILYKPKDIVAGDFYWMEQKGDLLLFAAADCTGHGVPGAMVSVVCNHALNRSVREYNLSEPGKILDKTRELVIEEFEKSEEGVKDGMDISLCGLNLKTNTLTWSGANNPLWIIRKKDTEVEELKANKQPIGKYVSPEPFDTHTIQLETGDSIYIFTDGYADQFGGDKGKKFKAKNMRELVLSIQDQSMDHQREAIDIAFEEWKKGHEQVDDVCVIGVRI